MNNMIYNLVRKCSRHMLRNILIKGIYNTRQTCNYFGGDIMNCMYESFAKFCEKPTRVRFRELVQFNTGEYDDLDFKKEWPESSKLAKHILAFANSGSGIIVIGIEETEEKKLISCGIKSIKDKAIINSQLSKYIPTGIEYNILDFTYSSSEYGELNGKSFQVMIVEYNPEMIPFVSLKEGKNIKENAIYIRQCTSSVLANYEQLQKLLNNRIATNYNTSSQIELDEHLTQLKLLYNKIKKYNYVYVKNNKNNDKKGFAELEQLAKKALESVYGEEKSVPNSNYPNEDYEEFISRMIEKKKVRIESLLDV
jgi:predicted HTH transcriptional regulator